MALKTTVPGQGADPIYDDSFVAAAALSSRQNSIVVWSAQSSGQPKVTTPSGQGVLSAGVLLNESDVALGGLAQIRMKGIVKIRASAALNAGVQVTVANTDGDVGAASSGDFVIGVSLEAAAEASQLIKCLIDTTSESQLN